ncbi:LOW QUALITY PROTEIN: hypothetical protein PHMEG_00037036, partial [Phytophthora megakarya]
LNVVGLRVRLKIKDGSTKDRREHVDHFIEILEDPDLADRLPLLRLLDADDLEEVLRARDRAKRRRKKTAFGSGKFRQNASNAARSAPAKQVRAIQIQAIDFGSDTSDGSDVSISEMDSHRRIYLTANQEVAPKEEGETIMPDPGHQDPGSMNHIHQEHRSKIQNAGFNHNRCSHSLKSRMLEICDFAANEVIRADHCLFVCRGCGEFHDMGKYPMEEFYNLVRQWFNPTKRMGMLPTSVDQVSKQRYLPNNTRDLHGNNTFAISCLCQADEYDRSDATMTFKPSDQETRAEITKPSRIAEYRRSGSAPTLDLLPRESRGYWKHHGPGNWFHQAKIVGKVHNEKANLLLVTGTEVSIVDIAFARKVGIYTDSSQIQDCVRIGDNVYRTEGRTRIKVTLAESLVYCFDIWEISLTKKLYSAWPSWFTPGSACISLTDPTKSGFNYAEGDIFTATRPGP